MPDSCCVEMEDACGWDYFDDTNVNKAEINKEVSSSNYLSSVYWNIVLVYRIKFPLGRIPVLRYPKMV